MDKLYLYKIDKNYIEYLSQFDKKVASSYGNKEKRPYIGIVLEIKSSIFFAPFTSPKEKHLKMKNKIDFLKICDGKYGAINFNNMIPILIDSCEKINVSYEKNELYRNLLYNQINWCNERINMCLIRDRAKKLYEKFASDKLPKYICDRCCDFKLLEKKCKEYKN